MNVLLITTTYPTPAAPQQGAFNRALVSALGVKHEVRVIAPIPWPQIVRSPSTVLNRGTRHAQTLHPFYFYPPKVLHHCHERFYWQSIRPTIKQLETEFRPDVVIGYWLHPDGSAALRAAEHFKVPCLVVSGGSDLRLLPENQPRRRAITKVLQEADRLIVVSRDLAERAMSLGTTAEKIDVIYRGVNKERFHPSNRTGARAACGLRDDAVVICWVGRLERVKHPSMLLHAAVHWRQRWGERLRVLMIGDGSLRKQLIGLRRRLDLEGVVRLEGSLPQQDLLQRYNAANVTVLTSHSEGIPNVLLESIACGVPFVATDVGGVSEIATPNVDRLVPDSDVPELAEAVVWRVDARSGDPRIFVPDNVTDMAKRFETVFHRVLAPAGCPRSPGNSPAPLTCCPHNLQEVTG